MLVLDKAFSHNNISFPSNYLRLSTASEKEAQGISWKDIEEPPVVRAPLEREKADGIARVKDTVGKMLAGSDWMYIAKSERNRDVAQEWVEYRAAVIAEKDRLKTQFGTAASYEAIDAIVQNWPINPDEQAERDRMEAEEAAAKAKREEREDA